MKKGFSSRHTIASIGLAVLRRTSNPVHFMRYGWWIRGSATLALIAISLIAGHLFFLSGNHSYHTAVGGYLRATLLDGSIVELNTDTRLRVHLRHDERLIEMHHGEATFTVEPDENRPFIVTSGQTRVRAVGTVFNVRQHSPGHVSVIVTEGKVAVTHEPQSGGIMTRLNKRPAPVTKTYTVSAGAIAEDRRGRISVGSIDAREEAKRLSWHEGRLRFDGNRLSEVVDEFNRYNTLKLVVADPSIAELSVGGQFSTTGIDAFLLGWPDAIQGGHTERERNPESGAEVVLLYGPKSKP